MPTKINAFTRTLTVIMVQAKTLMIVAICADRLRLINATVAMVVAIGATKRNHSVNISARLKRGQKEILRSMGNESRNMAKPPRAGRHQTNTGQAAFRSGVFPPGVATSGSSVPTADDNAAQSMALNPTATGKKTIAVRT